MMCRPTCAFRATSYNYNNKVIPDLQSSISKERAMLTRNKTYTVTLKTKVMISFPFYYIKQHPERQLHKMLKMLTFTT